MIYQWMTACVVLLHAGFVVFVVLGGYLALRWRWLVWIHIPAAIWGVAIEFTGNLCPLTPLENELRLRAGMRGYTGGFIDHYVVAGLYPNGLTRRAQYVLGTLALAINLVAYAVMLRRARQSRAARPATR